MPLGDHIFGGHMFYEIEAQILTFMYDARSMDEYYFVLLLLQAHLTFLWECPTPFFALTPWACL